MALNCTAKSYSFCQLRMLSSKVRYTTMNCMLKCLLLSSCALTTEACSWQACICHPNSAAHPECRSLAGLQHPAMASVGFSNPIQETDDCPPRWEWHRPILHPGLGQTIHPSQSTMLCYCQTACCSLFTAQHWPIKDKKNGLFSVSYCF